MNNIEVLKQIALDYIYKYKTIAINSLNSSDYYPGLYQEKEDLCEECEKTCEKIKKIMPLKAKWILSSFQNEEDNTNNNYQYECSNCGHGDIHAKDVYVPYCWHCGAKMEDN